MKDSDPSRWRLVAIALLLWLGGQAPLRASPVRNQTPEPRPVEDPRIKIRTENDDLDWSPLKPGKTRQPLPEAKRLISLMAHGEAKDLEEVIRTSYFLTSAYARNEGHDLVFELSDFQTVYTPEALRLKYGDLVSLDIPDQIAILGVSRSHTQQDRQGKTLAERNRRGYAAKWEPKPPLPDRDLWAKRSMSEIVEIGREMQPELARLRAVTSYRATVVFEGIRRSYRASFVWMGGIASPAIERFEAWEPVANRVGLVLLEETPPEADFEASEKEPYGLGRLSVFFSPLNH